MVVSGLPPIARPADLHPRDTTRRCPPRSRGLPGVLFSAEIPSMAERVHIHGYLCLTIPADRSYPC